MVGRRILRIATALVAALALLVLGAGAMLVAVSHGWQRERLRVALEQVLSRALDARVRIAALEGPLHAGFQARGVSLELDDEPLLELASAGVEVGELTLLPRPRVVLGAIRIEGARLHVVRDAAGGWSFDALRPAPPAPEQPPSPPGRWEPLVEVRGVSIDAGSLVLQWVQDGTPRTLDASFALRAEDLRIGGEAGEALPRAVRLQLRLEPGARAPAPLETGALELDLLPRESRWTLSRGELRGAGIELRAEGAGDSQGIERLLVEGEVRELADLAPLLPDLPELAGGLSVVGELTGPFAEPKGAVTLRGERVVVRGVRLGTLDARVRAAGDGTVEVESFALARGELVVRARSGARLRVRESGLAFENLRLESLDQSLALDGAIAGGAFQAVRVEARNLDLVPLARLAGAPVELSGRLDAQLALSGPLGSPSVTGRFGWRDPSIGEVGFARLDLALAASPADFAASASVRSADQEILKGEVRLPPEPWSRDASELLASPRTGIDLEARRLDLSTIARLLPEGARELHGSLDADFVLRGGDPHPARVALQVASDQLSIRGESLSDLRLDVSSAGGGVFEVSRLEFGTRGRHLVARPGGRLRLATDRLHLESLELASDGASLELAGGVGRQGFEDLRLVARDLRVAPLMAMAGANVAVEGRLDANLSLEGAFDIPRVAGEVQWREARLGSTPVDHVILGLETEATEIHAVGRIEREGTPVFEVEGWIPRELRVLAETGIASPALVVELRANALDLALARPFVPRTVRDLRGSASGWLRLRGGDPLPEFTGSVELADGSVRVPSLGRTFAPVAARVHLEPSALVVDEIRVGEAGAQSKLVGTVALEALSPRTMDLRLGLEHFPLRLSRLVQGAASGEITAQGPVEGLVLRGNLETEALRILLPRPSDPSAKEIRVLAGSGSRADANGIREAGRRAPDLVDRADLDLRLRVPEDSWIRGTGANLEVAGALRLTKPPLASSSYSGSLRVVRGSYRLHGKNFLLDHGTATLDGGGELDPILDVEASHRVRDVRVIAEISGRASDPQIRLRSDPVLPDADVLSYLLFGRPASDVATSGESALQTAATQMAAGMALDEVQALTGDVIPLDTIDVRLEEGGSSAIELGRHLTDRLFVRYGRTLGPDPEDEVRVEIRLNTHWSVESQVTSGGEAGADLLWSVDY